MPRTIKQLPQHVNFCRFVNVVHYRGVIYNAGALTEITGTAFFDNDAMPDRSNAIFNGMDAILDPDLKNDLTNSFGPSQNIFEEQ